MYLVKFSELSLHGKRKRGLINSLIRNIKKVYGDVRVEELSGRVVVHSKEDLLHRVFGISSYARALELQGLSLRSMLPHIDKDKGYKVSVKKTFSPLEKSSLDIAKEMAEELNNSGYRAAVKNADDEIRIEIRKRRVFAYLKSWERKGPGGFPYGSYGNGLVMFSGGFDSPVATWLAARKGLKLDFFAVMFNDDMEKEVLSLWRKLCQDWHIEGTFYGIRSCPITTGILAKSPAGIKQILLKKSLYYLAKKVAGKRAVITGESLNQTSTQRARLLRKIENNIDGLFLRPLITYTKEEVMEKAKEIGTYEMSLKNKEYCSIERVVREEAEEELIEKEFSKIRPLLDVLRVEELGKATIKNRPSQE
ncbi:MAG: hypothetical protein D6769_02490 [Methanobacteriota archaeon]|nr:MAG: hypothetical protein D6769_02490 [Euryarchaeota archaeon]